MAETVSDGLTVAERQHLRRDYEEVYGSGNRDGGADNGAEKPPLKVNVGQAERVVSILSGGLMLVSGLRRGGLLGLTMAGTAAGLLYRGTTGHCHIYDAMDVDTAEIDEIGVHVEESITVDRPVAELYQFWRDFSNLPKFMHHLESVEVMNDKLSRWTATAPAGFTVSWDAQIVSEKENESIMWKSLEDAQITNAGSVKFSPAPGGRGTEVRVSLSYAPPAGSVGVMVAKLFGEEPTQQIIKDLHRFKNLMETGEIPTTQGQSAGPSLKRRMKAALLPSATSAPAEV